MAAKSESNLQRRIQKALRDAFPGCYVRKIHVSEFQTGGIADLLCCIYGLFVAIEVKVPGEERSQLQTYEHDQVIKAGGISIVAHSPEQAVQLCRAAVYNHYGISHGNAKKLVAGIPPEQGTLALSDGPIGPRRRQRITRPRRA